MKYLFNAPADERIRAEINNIYRIGYMILTFGIALDIILQIIESVPDGSTFFRPVEFTVLMAANLICLFLMIRKGLGDDNRYAEAERFHHAHYLRVSVLTALASALVVGGAIAWRCAALGTDVLPFIALISGVSIFVCTAPAIYALNYIVFRLAKKRRDKIEKMQDDEE